MKLLLAVLLLASCGAAVPAVVATSYVSGQVAAAYMPDSIERPDAGQKE